METAQTLMLSSSDLGIVFALLGATLSVVLCGIGSSIGIGKAGAKASGVMAERPELFGRLLVLTALPGSQGVYGLLIAILGLTQIQLLTGTPTATLSTGLWIFTAGLLMGLAGLFSGIHQGKVAAGGVGATARDASLVGRAIVLSVMVETYAIFGLLVSLLIVNSIA